MDLKALKAEMESFYSPLRGDRIERNSGYMERKKALWSEMDAYAAENPEEPACLLKAKLQELIADSFEPAIFPRSPFFFEMGVRFAESWGTPSSLNFASWLLDRRGKALRDTKEFRLLQAMNMRSPWKLWQVNDVFDADHHSLNYSKLLGEGVEGVLAEIRQREEDASLEKPQRQFLEAARRGCLALLKTAEKFASKAEAELKKAKDEVEAKNLSMIASAARRVPAKPPRDFHEGLAAILFLREATASLENVGISVLGRPDLLLGRLLRRDMAEGVLDEEEAKSLIARWMLHTDVKFHVDDNPWPETSTCVELGGCDASGTPLFNEATRLFIEAHCEAELLNPKLNCRYSSKSPDAYLALLAKHASSGRNNFAFLNDDVLIPACVRAGKSVEEARNYVNGGCQETIVEGVEHSAGAYYYFNMARALDLFLRPLKGAETPSDCGKALPCPLKESPASFEELYEAFLKALGDSIAQGAEWLRSASRSWPEAHPCPILSSGLSGCLEKAKDYTEGGARHNPAGIALVGLGTIIDSLLAIKESVYGRNSCSFGRLQEALEANWEGEAALRALMTSQPKFGHGDEEADAFAGRLAKDIVRLLKLLRNERGGPFQPSFFVYYMFVHMGAATRATPDGRRDGEFLSQGVAPGRVSPPKALTETLRAMSAIDLKDFPGNAVLDVQLPLAAGTKGGESFAGLMRSFAKLGGATLQPNFVSPELLEDAQRNPDRHGDLLVRISGLSAKFVALPQSIQDEIIGRSLLPVS